MGRIGIKAYATQADMISAVEQASQLEGQVVFEATNKFFWKKTSRTTTNISDYEKLVDFSTENRSITNLNILVYPSFLDPGIPDPTVGDRTRTFVYVEDENLLYMWLNNAWVPASSGDDVLTYWDADPNKVYTENDLVVYEGDIYVKLNDSDNEGNPDADPDWAKVSSFKSPEAWDNTKTYIKGDRVYYNNEVWECIVDTATGSPQSAVSEWVRVEDSWNVWPVWRPSANYFVNDVVNHKGLIFKNVSGGVDGSPPDVDVNGHWEEISNTAYIDAEEFDPDKTYNEGDIVKDSDGRGFEKYWIVQEDGTLGNPNENPNDYEEVSDQYIAVPKFTNADYVINDIIAYRGILYRNVTGLSNYPVAPDSDTVNWIRLDNLEAEIYDLEDSKNYEIDDRFIRTENYYSYTPIGDLKDWSDMTELKPGDSFFHEDKIYKFTYVTSDQSFVLDAGSWTPSLLLLTYTNEADWEVTTAEVAFNNQDVGNPILSRELIDLTIRSIWTKGDPYENGVDNEGFRPWTGSQGIEAAIPKWLNNTLYKFGDIVEYNNAIYRFEGTNLSTTYVNPDNDDNWYAIFERDNFFDPSRTYLKGSVVEYKGQQYVKKTSMSYPEIAPDDSDHGADNWALKGNPPFIFTYPTYADMRSDQNNRLTAAGIDVLTTDSDSLRSSTIGTSMMIVENTNSRWVLDVNRTINHQSPVYTMVDEEFVASEISSALLDLYFDPTKYNSNNEKAKIIHSDGTASQYASDGTQWVEIIPVADYVTQTVDTHTHADNDNSWANNFTIRSLPIGSTLTLMSETHQMVHVQNWNPLKPAGNEMLDTDSDEVFGWSRRQNSLAGDVWWPILTDKEHFVDTTDITRNDYIWDLNFQPMNYTAYRVNDDIWSEQSSDNMDTFKATDISTDVANAFASEGVNFNDFDIRVSQTPDSEVYLQFWTIPDTRWKLTASSTNTKNEGPKLDYMMIEFDSDVISERRFHIPSEYYERGDLQGFADTYELLNPLGRNDMYATAFFPNGPLAAGCLWYDHERYPVYDLDAERNWVPTTNRDQFGNFKDPDPSITIERVNMEGDWDSENDQFWFFGVKVLPCKRGRYDYASGQVKHGGYPGTMRYTCYRDGVVVGTYDNTLVDDYQRVVDPNDTGDYFAPKFYANTQWIDLENNSFHRYVNNKFVATMNFGSHSYDMYNEYRPGILVDKVEVTFTDWPSDNNGGPEWHRENFGISYFCPILSSSEAMTVGTGTMRNEQWVRVGTEDTVDNFPEKTKSTGWQRIYNGVTYGNLVNDIFGRNAHHWRNKDGSASSGIKPAYYLRDGYTGYYSDKIWTQDQWLEKAELIYNEFERSDVKYIGLLEQINSDLPNFWKNR